MILESYVGRWMNYVVSFLVWTREAVRRYSGQIDYIYALVDMLHHWHQALDESINSRVLFFDLAKAFDHVDQTTT